MNCRDDSGRFFAIWRGSRPPALPDQIQVCILSYPLAVSAADEPPSAIFPMGDQITDSHRPVNAPPLDLIRTLKF
jgi:hypothetical protein